MMMLKELSFETDFFWKGKRYTQVIRSKKTKRKFKGAFSVVCRLTRDPCGEWIDMPAGRKVKPVIKLTVKQTQTKAG